MEKAWSLNHLVLWYTWLFALLSHFHIQVPSLYTGLWMLCITHSTWTWASAFAERTWQTQKCITFISTKNLLPPWLSLTYGIGVSLTLLIKPGFLPDAIAIRNTIFNTSSAANFFFKLNHGEPKLTSTKWVRNKHLTLQSNIFLCCLLAALTSKNNQQHQHNMQTHTSLVYGMLQDTQNNFLCGFPKDKQNLRKTKKPLSWTTLVTLSKIRIEELLTASESPFTVRKTQSERHWVWGEVLTPKVSRPWKQSNKTYVLWSFPARRLHQLQPPREAAGGQHQGLCFCHNVLMLAVFYTSLDTTTAPQLSALQDIRLRLYTIICIPSFSSLLSSLCSS